MNGTEMDDSSLLTEYCLPELLRAFADEIQKRPSDTAGGYMLLAADEIERMRKKLNSYEINEIHHLNRQRKIRQFSQEIQHETESEIIDQAPPEKQTDQPAGSTPGVRLLSTRRPHRGAARRRSQHRNGADEAKR
tara:strand:- start:53 stop:457 length:405 start_codon:yes stop_codon:yes gene_type:complete